MKLKKFIKELEKISKEYGEDMEVIMADGIPAVEPVFSDGYYDGKNVVITDQK